MVGTGSVGGAQYGFVPDGAQSGRERAADIDVGMVAHVTTLGRHQAKPRDRLFEHAPIGL